MFMALDPATAPGSMFMALDRIIVPGVTFTTSGRTTAQRRPEFPRQGSFMKKSIGSKNNITRIFGAFCLIFMSSLSAYSEPTAMKTNTFADVFNDLAKRANINKSATLQECRKVVFSACLYSVDDNTRIVVGGKADDSPRSIAVVTLKKDQTISAAFTEEDTQIWPLIVQIANPDIPAEQRTQPVDRFNAMLKADQSSFTMKIGSIRYSAAAAPEMGVWMVANLKPVLSPSTWFGDWRQKVNAWIAKVKAK
jgi:hypothetical protein